jgi:hypothetical protein
MSSGMTFLPVGGATVEHAPATIIDILRKNIGGVVPQRSHATLHASDLSKEDFCPRKIALFDLLKMTTPDEVLSTELAVTFDVGNATADLFKEKWAGQEIVGHWQCRRCLGVAWFSRKPPAAECPCGGDHDLRYMEVQVKHDFTDATGSFDALMDCGGDKLVITELKIISPDQFSPLAAPMAEHRIRTQMYMRMLDQSSTFPWKDYISLDHSKVFYISRGHGKKHPLYNTVLPFKEYTIARDDALVDPYLTKGRPVKAFRDLGLMPQGVCAHAMCAQAIKCPVRTACFSGQYPPAPDPQ